MRKNAKVGLKVSGLAGAALFAMTTAAAATEQFYSLTPKSIYVRTNTGATTVHDGSFISVVPEASTGSFIVPDGDTELFTVEFTAQAELANGSSNARLFNSDDVLELQAQAVSGFGAIVVLNPPGPTAFASSNSPEAHTLSWARRFGAGSWRFRIMARVLDRDPAATVSAQLSKWTMTVRRYN